MPVRRCAYVWLLELLAKNCTESPPVALLVRHENIEKAFMLQFFSLSESKRIFAVLRPGKTHATTLGYFVRR